MKTTWIMAAACTAMGILGAARAVAADLANGGFESGSFLGWSYAGNTGSAAMPSLLARDPINGGTQPPLGGEWGPAGGQFFAALWSTDSNGSATATLSQEFDALAGQNLEFDYFFDFGDLAPNYDSAVITLHRGAAVLTLLELNTNPANQLADDFNIDWTHLSFLLADAGTYRIEFQVTDTDGTFESVLGVDNVAVTPAPGTALFALTAMALAGRRRR